MAKPVTIGTEIFPTKKAALEAIRNVRDRYEDRVPLSRADDEFMRDLLSLHSEAIDKFGVGVSHFTVATEAVFGGRNRHFVLHRHDGSSSDFSFMHCVTPEAKNRNDRILALRQAIKEQTWRYREQEFSSGKDLICPYEQVEITPDNCQIDHQSPWTFDALVLAWLTSEGISLEDVQITPPADNQLVAQMSNAAQSSSWRSFHHANAKLRLLSTRGNLSGAKHTSI